MSTTPTGAAPLRVLVCGGRKYGHKYSRWPLSEQESNDEFLEEYKHIIHELNVLSVGWMRPEDMLPNCMIIAGDANGVDSVAIDWAVVNWCPFEVYKADWKKYGKAAGYFRNKRMLEEGKPNLVVAFPGGKGTNMMCKLAREAGVEVIRIEDRPRSRDERT